MILYDSIIPYSRKFWRNNIFEDFAVDLTFVKGDFSHINTYIDMTSWLMNALGVNCLLIVISFEVT